MARTMTIEMHGLRELEKQLAASPKDMKTILRGAVHKIAGDVRDAARQDAPGGRSTGRDASGRFSGGGSTGALKKGIKTKRRRGTRDEVLSHVYIVKGPSRYWHFGEFGTIKQTATPYIGPAVLAVGRRAPITLKREVMDRFVKLVARRAKRAGR